MAGWLDLIAGIKAFGPVDLEGNAQGTPLAVSTTAAQTPALAAGVYDIWCLVDCYVKVGPTANDVTATSGYYVRNGNTVTVKVRESSKLGVILGSGTSTFSYHKVG